MDLCLRDLNENDLNAADEVLSLAFGGPSRLDDLRLYRQIQPDGWFAAEFEDRLVGMVGAANYGAFAHVGLMAVHPGFRRQGIGLALMQFLLQRLEAQRIPLVTLDSSPMGRPLYDQLGFVPYDETLVFHRREGKSPAPSPSAIQAITPADLDELVHVDTPIFGADRRKVFQALLDRFPGRALLQRDSSSQIVGYLFPQNYRIGPWVMLQPERAEALLQAALGPGNGETVTVTVPSVNQAAVDLLRRYGFEHVRSNRHMTRGPGGCPGDRTKIYSQMSLAIG